MTQSGSSERLVEQTAVSGQRVQLLKSLVPIRTADGQTLIAVRKRPLGEARAAVVTVHGFGQNRYSFHLPSLSLTTWLAAQGFDTFNLDLRGHGRSRRGSSTPSSADAYFRYDVPAALNAAWRLSGKKVFAIGHSLGGAAVYAGSTFVDPERLAGLIPLAPVFAFGGRQPLFKWAGSLLQYWPQQTPLARMPLPVYAVGGLLLASQPLVDHPLIGLSPVTIWHPGSMQATHLRQRLYLGFDRVSLGVAQHLLKMAATGFVSADGQVDYAARFRLAAPTPLLVIAGDRDTLLPPSDAKAGYLASAASDKTFMVVGKQHGGQHWGHVDLIQGRRAPEFVWQPLRDWMLARV